MKEQAMNPLARMKPQHGRKADAPAPVMYVPALSGRTGGVRWRLVAFAAAASAVGAVVCTSVAAFVA